MKYCMLISLVCVEVFFSFQFKKKKFSELPRIELAAPLRLAKTDLCRNQQCYRAFTKRMVEMQPIYYMVSCDMV